MFWILGSIAVLIIAIVIFFLIPYSPTGNEFRRDVERHSELASGVHSGVFTEEVITNLPAPIQNFFKVAGWMGQPIPNSVSAFFSAVPLYQASDRSPMIIDYTLHLFSHPVRLAYIQTSFFGIPFEGFDSSQEGTGFMRGVIGKVLTLFNQTGRHMDSGQILTWLGEAPLLPSIFLSEYIAWEAIDATHVRATLNYRGVCGSGIFTFDENGFLQSFHTYDRARTGTDGSIEFIGWSAIINDWRRGENGVYLPYSVGTVWHESGGDLTYFSSSGFDVEFN